MVLHNSITFLHLHNTIINYNNNKKIIKIFKIKNKKILNPAQYKIRTLQIALLRNLINQNKEKSTLLFKNEIAQTQSS